MGVAFYSPKWGLEVSPTKPCPGPGPFHCSCLTWRDPEAGRRAASRLCCKRQADPDSGEEEETRRRRHGELLSPKLRLARRKTKARRPLQDKSCPSRLFSHQGRPSSVTTSPRVSPDPHREEAAQQPSRDGLHKPKGGQFGSFWAPPGPLKPRREMQLSQASAPTTGSTPQPGSDQQQQLNRPSATSDATGASAETQGCF